MRVIISREALVPMAKGRIDSADIDGWITMPAGEEGGGRRIPVKHVSGGGGKLMYQIHPDFAPEGEDAQKRFAELKKKTLTLEGEDLKKAHEIAKQVAENTKDVEKKEHAERHAKSLEKAIKPVTPAITMPKAGPVTIKYTDKKYEDDGELGTAANGSQYVQVRSDAGKGIPNGTTILLNGFPFEVNGRGKDFSIGKKWYIRLYATAKPIAPARQKEATEDEEGNLLRWSVRDYAGDERGY